MQCIIVCDMLFGSGESTNLSLNFEAARGTVNPSAKKTETQMNLALGIFQVVIAIVQIVLAYSLYKEHKK